MLTGPHATTPMLSPLDHNISFSQFLSYPLCVHAHPYTHPLRPRRRSLTSTRTSVVAASLAPRDALFLQRGEEREVDGASEAGWAAGRVCSSGPPPIPVQSVGTSAVHGSERGAMPALLRSASLARPHFPFPRPNTKGTTTCSACTTNPGIRDFIDSRIRQLGSEPTRDTGREGTRRRAASVSVLPPPHTRGLRAGFDLQAGSAAVAAGLQRRARTAIVHGCESILSPILAVL